MKIRFVFLILVIFLLTACRDTSEGIVSSDIETEALAGFIKIQGDTLHITPVEVFILCRQDYDNSFFHDPAMRSVVCIDLDDILQLVELGLNIYDFPSGIHIRPNWHSDKHWYYVEKANIETVSFQITEETEFVFVDNLLLFDTNPEGNRQRITNDVDEFLHYLFPSVVHFIEVYDARVIRLFQDFGFTL